MMRIFLILTPFAMEEVCMACHCSCEECECQQYIMGYRCMSCGRVWDGNAQCQCIDSFEEMEKNDRRMKKHRKTESFVVNPNGELFMLRI